MMLAYLDHDQQTCHQPVTYIVGRAQLPHNNKTRIQYSVQRCSLKSKISTIGSRLVAFIWS